MAKVKPSGPQHYEILFIISNKFTEEEALKSFEKVISILENLKAVVTLKDFWGKKKLAYPINHEPYGYYGLLEFDIEGVRLKELEEKLRLDSEIVRFIVVKKKVRSEAEIKKEKQIKAKIDRKQEEEEEAAEAEEKKKTRTKKETPEISLKKDSKKSDLKSLDEKLDDILKVDSLI